MTKGIYIQSTSRPYKRIVPLQRFLNFISVNENGCWEWKGAIGDGYGQFWDGARQVPAHRFSYDWFNQCKLPKFVPGGLQLDHKCRNRKCVNPDHLELVTHRINTIRGLTPLLIAKFHRAKTHCPHGHPYDRNNTILSSKGHRICRECRIQRNRGGKTLCLNYL